MFSKPVELKHFTISLSGASALRAWKVFSYPSGRVQTEFNELMMVLPETGPEI
jgi:hypothetical protein